MNPDKIAALFKDWDVALIDACLQGHMGTMAADDEANPQSACIQVGDFYCFAGKPDEQLLHVLSGFKLLVPRDAAWARQIEAYFGHRAKKITRYAMKPAPGGFDREKLTSYIEALEEDYELRLFNKEIFELAKGESWSADLCAQFPHYEDYERRAVGAAILHKERLVSGASTYALYDTGIEIEIDTKPEYRQKGLATVCAARLILECLSRGLHPGWDAHDQRSASLAEKLGYQRAHPYVAYVLDEG